MRPRVLVIIEPDQTSDYVDVRVSVLGQADDGQTYYFRAFEQVRLAQELHDHMAVEPWLLASLMEHTDAIKRALATRINQGSKTLMVETVKQEQMH